MDNRRLVKWFDIRYHEKFEAFCRHIGARFAGYLNTQKNHISVWAKKPDGTISWVINYERDNHTGGWVVGYASADDRLKSLSSYFEDTESITEQEWSLFEMCEPEMVEWLGKNTLKATDIELMLKGRTMMEIM